MQKIIALTFTEQSEVVADKNREDAKILLKYTFFLLFTRASDNFVAFISVN
jgi:hypothetical protein